MLNGVPVKIVPGELYIGDADCVKEGYKKNLHERGITAILNMVANKGTPADLSCLASEWKEGMEDGRFLYKDIQADDHKTYPLIKKHWKEAEKFIKGFHAQARCQTPGSGWRHCQAVVCSASGTFCFAQLGALGNNATLLVYGTRLSKGLKRHCMHHDPVVPRDW